MAKLPLDLSKFKKVGGDKETTTLRHSDGHEIKLAHGALSPKVRGQLASLPMLADQRTAKVEPVKMMAEGGESSSSMPTPPPADTADAIALDAAAAPPLPPPPSLAKHIGASIRGGIGDAAGAFGTLLAPIGRTALEVGKGVIGMEDAPAASPPSPPLVGNSSPYLPAEEAAQAAKSEIAQGVSQSAAAAAAPEGMGSAPKSNEPAAPDVVSGYQKQVQGIQDLAAAQSAAMTAQRQEAERAANAEATAMQTFKDEHAALANEYQGFLKDVKEHHIDPNRYIGSMETDQKIMTGIGLILGGISSGMTGKSNPALDFLNNQISRDIDAQKATLGQKESLLAANMRQFGNLRDAAQMTHAMMAGITANKMREAALKSGDQEVIARANIAAGQLESSMAPAFQQLAIRQGLMKNGMMGVDVAKFIPFVVPEHERAAAYKEAGQAKEMMKLKDNALSAFDQLREIDTKENWIKSPIQTAARISAIRDPILAQLSKDVAGRFTEYDSKMFGGLFGNRFDNDQTALMKRVRFERLLGEKMNFPVLSANNLDPMQMPAHNSGMAASAPSSSMPPDHSAAIKWAQANPKSPWAAQVLHKAKILGY